jgi:hypothetical protein
MIFVTTSPKQAEQYSYICHRLKNVVNKMHNARKTLEAIANGAVDKSFAKCIYMLTSATLQCENEILSQIDSLNCNSYEDAPVITEKQAVISRRMLGVEPVCRFFEEVYVNSYRKLLSDKRFSSSLKLLIQNHLQTLMGSLTQLRLFNDVRATMN